MLAWTGASPDNALRGKQGVATRKVLKHEKKWDAVVVGSGPNGMTAAAMLARAGLSVLVLEARERVGGGSRTEELTLPGFHHDVCSAIHPTGVLSPAFRELGLREAGLEWVHPEIPLAHPLPDGSAALLHQSLDQTAEGLGLDAGAWKGMFAPLLNHGTAFFDEIFQPMLHIPRHPIMLARFGMLAVQSCASVVQDWFQEQKARALFTGCAAHSILPLDQAGTAAFGVILALSGHAAGWPCARGGSGSVIAALEKRFRESGGEIETGRPVRNLGDLPDSRVVLFDLSPRQVADIAGTELPKRYRKGLLRFRYGPGVFKADYALRGPIPWRNPDCARAATVHVGGTFEEMVRSEQALERDEVPDEPFLLVAQQSLFDATRAPNGNHTAWMYCHVPNGCTVDMTERIERQMERFAPGFRDLILARHVRGPAQIEADNPAMIGGDIGGGANSLWQFMFRPVVKLDPYATPNERFYICSASTPPGAGVHGMCGYGAAKSALARVLGKR